MSEKESLSGMEIQAALPPLGRTTPTPWGSAKPLL
jgi:hypothetical protein